MELHIWLAKNKMTATALAHKLYYHPHYLQGVKAGNIKAGKRLARMIEGVTGGEVTMQDVLSAYKLKITDQSKEKGK